MPLKPASELPPLPAPSADATPEYWEGPAQRKWAVSTPSDELIAGLQGQGWLYAGANDSYSFWERPGYWLRIAGYRDGSGCTASIAPEQFRVPRPELGQVGYGLEFPPEMQAPEYSGKGARTRAIDAARELWTEHAPYLKAFGIDLTAVCVKQFRGSGRGGYIAPKAYRKLDLFAE